MFISDIDVVFCSDYARQYAGVAETWGIKLGTRLPRGSNTVTKRGYPLYFADQEWKEPDRAAYMAALALHRPHSATVLDLEKPEQLSEVLDWAHEAAQYARRIIIIPKAHHIIDQLPHTVGGAEVVLGYSVRLLPFCGGR